MADSAHEDDVAPEPSAWQPPVLTPQHRADILNGAIAQQLSIGGRLVANTPPHAVVSFGGEANHVLHLLLSLVTCGFWLIIWFLVAVTSGERRVTLYVDEFGRVISNG